MAGHVTLSEVKSGAASLTDLMKINAIMDYREACDAEAMKRQA